MSTTYNTQLEAESLDFIRKLTGQTVPKGKDNVQKALKDGKILAEFVFSFPFVFFIFIFISIK